MLTLVGCHLDGKDTLWECGYSQLIAVADTEFSMHRLGEYTLYAQYERLRVVAYGDSIRNLGVQVGGIYREDVGGSGSLSEL